MPTVSVIIPTCNRPVLAVKAVKSALSQTYRNLEVIVVDDGLKERAEEAIALLNDPRIKYFKHEQNQGGAAARNTGIKMAQGDFIAFLDDDDEWLPEKLETQMKEFINTPPDVGFCFCAVVCIYSDTKRENSQIPEGINNYFERALKSFNSFLTVTLIIKKNVFKAVGCFDENFPSHQEPDLMIRVTKQFKGLGVNQPLVLVNMRRDHRQIGSDINKRIAGRRMILEKYSGEFSRWPKILAFHYFQLGIFYRDNHEFNNARHYFFLAWQKNLAKLRFLGHYMSMLANGRIYKINPFIND